jgi:hypothetical protein
MIGALYSKAFAFGQVGKAILRRKMLNKRYFFVGEAVVAVP